MNYGYQGKKQYFERQAVYYGRQIVYDYADTREHP